MGWDVICAALGAVASFFVASIVMTGWPRGLIPNLSYPYIYAGDALAQYWMTERVIEGWIYENPRSGFPFGSPSFDFPGSDAGNLLVAKFLGKALGGYVQAANAYFLLGFAVTFAVTFIVLRRFSLLRMTAIIGAFLFTFTPYHFARMFYGHTFYTWYFVVPLYVYLGFLTLGLDQRPNRSNCIKAFLALALASCFGVYFAFFGVIVIVICGLAGAVKSRSRWPVIAALSCVAAISVGVACNVAPSVWYTLKHGKNPDVAQRVASETEMFSLKLMHMIMPNHFHQVPSLAQMGHQYAAEFPLSNTNGSIGLIGVIGLILMGATFIRQSVGHIIDKRARFLVLLTGSLLLIATVGGLNVLFAIFVSPMIRGWDRISIFIAFLAILSVMLSVDALLRRRRGVVSIGAVFALTAVAFADQTPAPGSFVAFSNRSVFEQDRDFMRAIEAHVPLRSAIYQLPYLAFPEVGPLNALGTYDHLTGFLNSKRLRWSSGGMRGRAADHFYRDLSSKPLADQIAKIKELGFAGIYVDRRGYADNGASVVAELTAMIGAPSIGQPSGPKLFFNLLR